MPSLLENKRLLPQKIEKAVFGRYCSRYGLTAWVMDSAGEPTVDDHKFPAARAQPLLCKARADALQEAVRWGEPFIFFLAPGIVAWVIPLVEGDHLHGGVVGGEVMPEADPRQAQAAADYLAAAGLDRNAAQEYVASLPVFSLERAKEAADYLFSEIYRACGWKPALLEQHRASALQQREIAEEIHRRKGARERGFPVDQERMLLSLIRAGDKNGVRRALNQVLAAMFLYSPRLAVIRARAVELMGYLVRAAVEDSPLLDSLLEQHQRWIMQLLEAPDFESLCNVLRLTLDDFIDSIFLQGYNRTNRHVHAALTYLAAHYAEGPALAEVAKAAGLSPFRIAHLVKDCTGKTVLQHLKRIRIEQARARLEQSDDPSAVIAYDVGYADQSYFIKHFRELTGHTPAKYRKLFQGA